MKVKADALASAFFYCGYAIVKMREEEGGRMRDEVRCMKDEGIVINDK